MSVRTQQRRSFFRDNWKPDGPNTCFYCHKNVQRKERSIDHLTPESRGGDNKKANLVLCCRECNNAKSDMTLAEFVDFVAANGGIERTKLIFGRSPESRRELVRPLNK